ncbi:MAG: hypothetical protein ACK5JM_09450 [Rhodoblastus sp.]
MSSFGDNMNRLRKRSLPPSVNDIEWRFDTVFRRLQNIEEAIDGRLPFTPANQSDVLATMRLLEPRRVEEAVKARFGSVHDGGYVMLDDFSDLNMALSFGVSVDDSWDLEIARRGVRVLQFDHTIDAAPSSHELLQFHKTMIAASPGPGRETLSNLVRTHSRPGRPDILLKIDIEGDEWSVFAETPIEEIGRCAQILCEFHDLRLLCNEDVMRKVRGVFEKLTSRFAVAHVHANNCGPLCNVANVPVPDVLEILYVNRERYRTAATDELFPTALDAPNRPSMPDIYLGSFRY